MSNDLNQCNFIGRLGKDVDLRFAANGKAIASFSIAVGSSWKNKQTGNKEQRTEWVNITVFGKLAEICGEYLKKGSQVFISGEFRTEKWTDKSNVERYTTKVIANNMQLLGGRSGQGGGQGQGQARPQGQDQGQSSPQGTPAPADFDDDIPF